MKTFAVYEKEFLFIGSPDFSKQEFHRFKKSYSFWEFLPKKWQKYVDPYPFSNVEISTRDSKNNLVFLCTYKVYFPLTWLLKLKSQQKKFAQIFDEFKGFFDF